MRRFLEEHGVGVVVGIVALVCIGLLWAAMTDDDEKPLAKLTP